MDSKPRPRYRYIWPVWVIFTVPILVLLHFYPLGLSVTERYVLVPLVLLIFGHLGWWFGWGKDWWRNSTPA